MANHQDKAGSAPAGEQESRFERWSRRKLAAAAEIEQAPPTAETAPSKQLTDPLTDADMPPIESLDEHCDVSEFFSSGVSDELRQLALRKLFHLPKFNVCDGLDDYAEDYTSFEPLGGMITADMRHQLERTAQRAREMLAEDPPPKDTEQVEPGGLAHRSEQDDPTDTALEGEQHERG